MPTPTSQPQRPFWLRALRFIVASTLALAVIAVAWGVYAFRDRNPGYSLSIDIDGSKARNEPRALRAGFARGKINPTIGDPARPVWMAGFSNGKAATAIHDDLWAVATVIDDGHTRVGLVVIDAIGFFHDDVATVRRAVSAASKLDYTIVCSTHNHSTPDLMGLWGSSPFVCGVDPVYRDHVIASAAKALDDAAGALQPVRMETYEIPTPPDGLVTDTRKPDVFDSDLRVMLFRATNGPTVLGSITGWGNHPETPWSKNTEITADFPGVLRAALEDGVSDNGALKLPGLGGIHVFVNGCVGGLMTTHPSVTVRDPFLQRDFKEPSHDKTRALGRQLARRILDRVSLGNTPAIPNPHWTVRARTLEVPLDNPNFLLATYLGVLKRGHSHWKKFRTEVAVLTLGDASMVCIPGEIYPELVNGGVEQPEGADFGIPPLEVPPIREMLPGRVKFVFGLANDEIGYILPRSQWDTQPPYTYGKSGAPYGEVNSVGPQTAQVLHEAIRELTKSK